MDIRNRLNLGIDKTSKNLLLIFPDSRTKELFKKYFGDIEMILLTSQNLFHKLDGLRYREYKFLNRDIVYKLIDEVRRTNEDM